MSIAEMQKPQKVECIMMRMQGQKIPPDPSGLTATNKV